MSRVGPAFFALVGVLMFLGFGAALVSRFRSSMAAPDQPMHVSGPLLEAARSESWVAIDGASEPCSFPVIPSGSSTASYRLVAGAGGTVLGLADLSDERACTDAPHEMRGTLRVRPLVELELPPDAAQFFAENLGPEVPVLWVGDDPHLGLSETAMWGAMAALGLFIAWFYAAAFFARAAKVRLGARNDRPALPVLPTRPLKLAAAYRATPLIAIGFFFVCTVMFAGITAGQLPAHGESLDLGTMGLVAFGAVMTLVLFLLLLVTVRAALRSRPTMQSPRQAWAEVVRHEAALAKGVDVGNVALAYRDPFTQSGEPERIVEVVVGANEGRPWVVDGHVLVMRAEGDPTLYVLREDGGPFDLTDAEVAKLSA